MIDLNPYKKSGWSKPDSVNTAPDQKDDDYDKRHCEYFYHLWLNGDGAFPYEYRDVIKDNRNYWHGRQDPDKYKSYLYGNNKNTRKPVFSGSGVDLRYLDGFTKEQRRSGLNNINFSHIASPAPRLRNALHGMLLESDKLIRVKMIDQNSINKEQKKKWKRWVASKYQEQINALYDDANLSNPDEGVPMPASIDELEIMEFSGEFKLNYAKEAQKLIKHTEELSGYYDIREKVMDDMACSNFGLVEVKYNNVSNKEEYEWVDIANAGMQYSEESHFDKSEWAFKVRLYTVSELADKNMSTAQLQKAAKTHSGRFGNPPESAWDKVVQNSSWYTYKIPILEAYWKDIDVYKQIKYTRKNGRTVYRDVPFDTTEEDLKKREELVTTHIKKIRQAKWGVGCDILFDNGVMQNIVRGNIKEPELPIRGIRMEGKPLVSSIKHYLDDFHITFLKYQHAKAHAKMFGYQVNFDLLQGIKTEDGDMGVLEALKFWSDKGILPVSLIGAERSPNDSTRAVEPINGGMQNILQEVIQEFQLTMNMIQHETGLSFMDLERSPNEGQNPQLDTKELQGMPNTLKPFAKKIDDLKERVAHYAIQKIQLDIKYIPESRDAYSEVIGDMGVSLLKEAMAEKARMGAYLDSTSLAQERRDLLQAAQAAVQNGRDGKPGLEYDDYLVLIDMINKGQDPTEVRRYMTYRIEKRTVEQREFAMQQQQQQQQMQMQADRMRKEDEMRVNQMKVKGDIAIKNVEHANKLEQIAVEKDYDKEREKIEQSAQTSIPQ